MLCGSGSIPVARQPPPHNTHPQQQQQKPGGGGIGLATPLREIALELPDVASQPVLRIAWHADRMILGTRRGYFGVDVGTGAAEEVLALLPSPARTDRSTRTTSARTSTPGGDGISLGVGLGRRSRGGGGGGGGDGGGGDSAGQSNGGGGKKIATTPSSLHPPSPPPLPFPELVMLSEESAAVLTSGGLGVVSHMNGSPAGNPLHMPNDANVHVIGGGGLYTGDGDGDGDGGGDGDINAGSGVEASTSSSASAAASVPPALASVPPYVIAAPADGSPAFVYDRAASVTGPLIFGPLVLRLVHRLVLSFIHSSTHSSIHSLSTSEALRRLTERYFIRVLHALVAH